MTPIYHLATTSDWEAAERRGRYEAASLQTEGFIHCSTAAQLQSTADALFRGRDDLLLLTLDAQCLTAELRYEAPSTAAHEGASELFPHLYGPLNLDAVTAVEALRPLEDGSFAFPTLE